MLLSSGGGRVGVRSKQGSQTSETPRVKKRAKPQGRGAILGKPACSGVQRLERGDHFQFPSLSWHASACRCLSSHTSPVQSDIGNSGAVVKF